MSRFLNEREAECLLSEYGIPMAKSQVAMCPKEAESIAKDMEFPVVMKILSADIPHKTEAGCVFLKVEEGQVGDTFEKISQNASVYAPEAVIDGVLIQETARNGLEVIVGMKRDPQFGPVLMVGLGGIYVEVMKDISLRLLPVTREEARRMLRETKLYQMIAGARGKQYDEEALVDTLLKVSKMVLDRPSIEALDMNPLFLYEVGEGVKGVDALIQIT